MFSCRGDDVIINSLVTFSGLMTSLRWRRSQVRRAGQGGAIRRSAQCTRLSNGKVLWRCYISRVVRVRTQSQIIIFGWSLMYKRTGAGMCSWTGCGRACRRRRLQFGLFFGGWGARVFCWTWVNVHISLWGWSGQGRCRRHRSADLGRSNRRPVVWLGRGCHFDWRCLHLPVLRFFLFLNLGLRRSTNSLTKVAIVFMWVWMLCASSGCTFLNDRSDASPWSRIVIANGVTQLKYEFRLIQSISFWST